jgi:hypothetical protein
MFLFLSLPSDILILIIEHLPVSDLLALTSVCRKLYDLVSTHSSIHCYIVLASLPTLGS